MAGEVTATNRPMEEIEVAVGGILGVPPASIRESLIIAVDDKGDVRIGTADPEGAKDFLIRILSVLARRTS